METLPSNFEHFRNFKLTIALTSAFCFNLVNCNLGLAELAIADNRSSNAPLFIKERYIM